MPYPDAPSSSVSERTTWFLIDSGSDNGPRNMAVDEALLDSMKQSAARPVLRFYTWSQPTISVGYFQNVFEDFDLDACRQRGWPLVRRLTGGRAVFHDDELTYSIVLPGAAPEAAGGVLASYRRLSRGLLWGLRTLSLDAELISRQDIVRRRSTGSSKSPDCFASPSWYEIKVHGAKLVGSAQRRMPHGVLQHGSILLSSRGFSQFQRILRPTAQGEAPPGSGASKEAMTSLADLLPHRPSLNRVKQAVQEGFEQALGIRFVDRTLSQTETSQTEWLLSERYGTMNWNYHRKPSILRE